MTDARTPQDALTQMGELLELLRRKLGSPGSDPPFAGALSSDLGALPPGPSNRPASASAEAAALRPHEAHRGQILTALTALLAGQHPQPHALRAIAEELARQCGISRGVAREVVGAADAGGAFAREGEGGNPDPAPITGLSNEGSADMEACCRRAYRAALHAADPSIDILSAVPE